MISRTLIAAAVAAACTWPAAATAARDAYTADAGHWTVSTPSSVNESAPWKAADRTDSRRAQESAATSSGFSEVVTPLSVNESAPWLTAQQTRARNSRIQSASLPNPETPWSVNESGPARYAEEMRDRARHVASVRQARIDVARIESERLAAIERERLAAIEQERLASMERERLATAPESSTAAVNTPMEGTAPVNRTSSATDGAVNAPSAPGQQPTQFDQNVGLVDTRRATATTMTAAPESGGAGSSAASTNEMNTGSTSAATTGFSSTEAARIGPSSSARAPSNDNAGAEANSASGVGVTRSEGASVNGAAPVMNDPTAQSSPQTSVSTPLVPDRAAATSVWGGTSESDAGRSARGSESTPVNAYVTLHESAPQAGAR
ncbi:MAG TPA: hypothetical protein VGC70_03320 [Burkholderiales bacterium]